VLNAFLYHVASGQAWFSCGLLFLVLLALDLRGTFGTRPRWTRVARVVLCAAVCVAGATVTPLRLWLAVPLVVACLTYTFVGFASPSARFRRASGVLAGVSVLLALALELPYHVVRPSQVPRPQLVCVVADSLAAGLGGEKVTWPARLEDLTGVKVCDLSFAGADARSALRQQLPTIEEEDDPDAWVLVSIGGNDMLGRTTPEEFGESLDQLLAAACGDPRHPRTVLMVELPLIPGAWKFGAHQRRLAAKHGVVLIPKRMLAGVVLDAADVLDGLHLTPAGHERLARELAPWLGHR
jgi:lysophospholipase L1-like esterase